jgi:hypothetical protein
MVEAEARWVSARDGDDCDDAPTITMTYSDPAEQPPTQKSPTASPRTRLDGGEGRLTPAGSLYDDNGLAEMSWRLGEAEQRVKQVEGEVRTRR